MANQSTTSSGQCKPTSSGRYAVPMISHEEIYLPQSIMPNPDEQMKLVHNMPYVEGDIIVNTYMKSGTYWMKHLLEKMLKNDKCREELYGQFLEIVRPDMTKVRAEPGLCLTHLRPHRFPKAFQENKGKVVLMLRNPKDVAVSYYCHMKHSAMLGPTDNWDEYLQAFVDGNVPGGNYFEFLENWDYVIQSFNQGRQQINFELFYFEELKLNPMPSLQRLNKFLDCGKSNEELQLIYDECSIDKLRAKADTEMHKVHPIQKDKDGRSVLYRKGLVGDWKNYFTVAQNERFDKFTESRLGNVNFTFLYEG